MYHCVRSQPAFLLAIIAAIPIFPGCSGSDGSGGHGTELIFNGGQLYYTSAVTKEQAEKLGNYLVKEEFFDGNPKTVQLNRTGNTFEVRMVVKKGVEQDQEFIDLCKLMCIEISQNVFDSAQVDVHLCDEQLTTLKVVVPLG